MRQKPGNHRARSAASRAVTEQLEGRLLLTALTYTNSYIGNSFGYGSGTWVQDDIQGSFVTSDGTVYTNSHWDEGGHEAAFYKNGNLAGNLPDLHGWGRDGGLAITADANYVYAAIIQTGDDGANTNLNSNGLRQYPNPGIAWIAIERYTRAGAHAAFATGYGWVDDMLVVNTVSSPYTNSVGGFVDEIHGLAIDPNGLLYASDPDNGLIHVYKTSNMSSGLPLTLPRAGQIATNSGSSIWVIQNSDATHAADIVQINSTTGAILQTITGPTNWHPTDLSFNAAGQLMVTDAGPDENIKIYNVTGTPTLTSTFGTTGGYLAGTGATIGTVGPLRFNDPVGVGTDSSGNIYVLQNSTSTGGGTIIESYLPAGTRNWVLYGLEFVDNAAADPAAPANVYTKEEHFVMNYNAPAGQGWMYTGYTVNPFKYPEDSRLHFTVNGSDNESLAWVQEIAGQRFLFITDQFSSFLAVYRFNPSTDGEIAIPSVYWSSQHITDDGSGWQTNEPSTGEWIWRDANGNGSFDAGEYSTPAGNGNFFGYGMSTDAAGDLWQVSESGAIREFKFQGLDAYGNPIWNYSNLTVTSAPAPFNSTNPSLERIQYDSTTDTMFLTGYTSTNPWVAADGFWGAVGTTVVKYSSWSTGSRAVAWTAYIPLSSTNTGKSIAYAGNYFFVAMNQTAEVRVYSLTDGTYVGSMTPNATVGSASGWVDTIFAMSAIHLANGQYNVFVEDDWHGKVMDYQWADQTLLPWIDPASAASWNSTTNILTVTGPTNIVADPGSTEPIIQANGVAAQLTFSQTTDSSFHIGGLTLTGGASATVTSLGARTATNYRVLVVGASGAAPPLTIDSTSKLNLTGNDLVDYSGNLANISSLITSGNILSTLAQTDAPLFALGVGNPFTTSFDNQTVSSSDVLIKFTYYGDATLDGKVDGSDYSRIDTSYLADKNTPGQMTGWQNGDFNHDGVINGSDYTLIDNAFNTQGAKLSSEIDITTPASPTLTTQDNADDFFDQWRRLHRRGNSILSFPIQNSFPN